MIRKLLIANRGEIACRVMATSKRMGIATVAVYSDADARAKHVAMADEAVRIGPPPVAESYLLGDRIIEAAQATGADAIHPGYGFLSENPDFVEAVEAAGLIFVGPPASAIRAMGLKDAAKALMEKAGVPVVPGYHGAAQDPARLAGEAEKIGYPVLIKARAGGGGKGMRLVEWPEDFAAALESAAREAEASFGDPACLVEKYITQPRHIEIQVFGDAHGNVVHLFERDCSLQRRHQKVIEEAPAPGMTAEVRAAMGAAAVEAARAIGYRGAGTIEFIADGSAGLRADGFWFMEMNTRLQVEHPVSEAITGRDFVELQLRVAAGEALPFAQSDLAIDGHAFEARIYAEDVRKGFLPATGKLTGLSVPEAAEFENAAVRVDSGVREGDTISPFYDPMIAKLIVHGSDRRAALAGLSAALNETHAVGTVTNVGFLAALAAHDGFAHGDVDTGLIARDLEMLTAPPPDDVVALAALEALGLLDPSGDDPWARLQGWRHWGAGTQPVQLLDSGAVIDRRVEILGNGRFVVTGGAEPVAIDATRKGRPVVAQTAKRVMTAHTKRTRGHVSVRIDGDVDRSFHFDLPDPLARTGAAEAGGNGIVSPMPGLVRVVSTAVGDAVAEGDPLIVLEAMKMEHTLTAPRDGIVAELLTEVGAQVEDGALLLSLEEDDG